MGKNIFLFLMILSFSFFVNNELLADAAPAAPTTITDLTSPSSPAAVILGVQPVAVAKPATPRAVGLSLLNGLTGQSQYGIEVDPYWLSAGTVQNLKYSDYYHSDFGSTIYRNFAISLMKSPSSVGVTTGMSSGTGIALGFRSLYTVSDDTLQNQVIADDAAYNKAVQAGDDTAIQAAFATEQGDTKKLQAFEANANMFSFEPAFALEADYPTNDFSNGAVDKLDLWLTADYTPVSSASTKLDAILVYRFIDLFQTAFQTGQQYNDLGGSLRLQLGDFSFSYEYVGRINTTSYRTDGVLQLAINNDDQYITGTFGTDYANASSSQPLLAIIGINFGLGTKPTITN